ncbi:RDD family protein [Roseibium marinum]|uniref:Putative RDD family membrane protein YckC n=1 Tax=Roseibium marinum TaxID=281252 RepID=A0A2S3UYN3_9HYPH|nr:RDD family protein [Roseibium marinum]POF32643.1 putative RDD family membrane protein YckC [Roseibium marinum]
MIRRLRKSKKDKGPSPDILMPPEGVALTLPVAGIGVRTAAQFTDIVLTSIAAVCLLVLLFTLELASPQSMAAIAVLVFFSIGVPYYVLAELAWNGQTLGKRIMKIKVVAHDGGPLSAHSLVLRNLMKEAEIFLPGTLLLTLDAASPLETTASLIWISIALLVPFRDRYRRRLGDMMAGTHVIHLPVPVLLTDLAVEKPASGADGKSFVFLSHQLDHYGAFELQTLETLLRARSTPTATAASRQTDAAIATIVEKIRKKIGYAEPVPSQDRLPFLKAFYNAQREHLEQRRLFGDRRENKHYAHTDKDI